ncbi:MAG: GAF domain-containing protein, partial [Candidatus Marinimicrobia bacterium]|nr:GAF domain-containing protein [Candidatus Neomarinimicrobiota bacterium]
MDAGNIKLLVIEDDPVYLKLLRRTLVDAVLDAGTSPGFEVVTAGNLRDGISLLARNNTDAVLLDLFLPDSQGQDTFRQLYSQAPYVPIIVMSSLDDQNTAIESVKAGAQDYLVKGQVAGDLLVRAIRYAIQRKQSERALQAAHDDLEQRIEDRTAELAQVNARLEEDIAARKKTEIALQASNSLLSAIGHVQSLYVSDARPEKVFDELLHVLVSVTQSEYGFIAEVLHDDTGQPYLQSRYVSDIAWNAEIERFYAENFSNGLKFTKLETLSGAAITSAEAVISNGPEADPRRYGLSSGHPPLNSFLGVPFYEGDTLVGMAGVANRPGGYDAALLDFLKPLTAAATSLIVGKRSNQRREEVEQALRDSEVKDRNLIQSGRD